MSIIFPPDTLSEFASCGLFWNCGKPSEQASTTLTWEVIASMVATDDWSDFLLERSNDIALFVRPISVDRYNGWNAFSVPIRTLWFDAREEVRSRTVVSDAVWKAVEPTVGWYIVLAAVEEAYADLDCPDYHRRMVGWLREGRFPCGWEGEYPAGRPIVY